MGLRKESLRVAPMDLLKIIGVGVLISLHWIFFFLVSQGVYCFCLPGGDGYHLTLDIFFGSLDQQKRIKPFEVALGLLVISGLLVIFQFENGYWLGLSMALVAAFLSALFSILNGRLTFRYSPYQITFYEMGTASLVALLFLPLYSYIDGSAIQWTWKGLDWFWLLILAGICTVYAFSVSVELMKRLPVFSINLTINLEPVYGILLAVAIFGEKEKMTQQFYLGTSIILLAVLIYPVLNYWNKKENCTGV